MLVSARNTFLALAVLVCPALLAQDTGIESNLPGAGFGPDNTSQSSAPVPTLHVFTRETLVDITVTDANGKPVRGLKRSDFTVLEDRQPQSIRSFHEFDANTVQAPTPSPQLPPNVYTNLQPVSGPLNVFLFDDINGGDGIRARSGLEAFIKKMEPGTQVALLGLGDHLTVLHGPTSDQASLLKVAEAAVKPFAITAAGCTARIYTDWATLDQLRELATYLSGIEGKKNVIWVGKGIPEMVFLGGCQDWTLPLQQTYDLLEDAQATLYPLDPGGVGPLGRKQLAMEAVAEATGGSAYYERNDLDYLMSEAVDAGSAYYSLSYAPRTTAYDGRYHNISITVDRPGLRLVYRKGYSSEDPARITHPPETLFGFVTKDPLAHPDTVADPLAAAMAPVAPPATKLLFDLRVQPDHTPPVPTDPPIFGVLDPRLHKAPLARYGLLYMLPQDRIAFSVAGNGSYTGALEFDITAFDSNGTLVTSRSQTLNISLTSDEYKQFIQKPFQFLQQIDLPPGQLRVRAGVRDTVSNKVGTIDVPLEIAKPIPSKNTASVK